MKEINLVLRIVQCLQNNKEIGVTTVKKIPYVLQYCGIDLGLTFEVGNNSPYSKEFDEILEKWKEEGLITITKEKRLHSVRVTDKFDISQFLIIDYYKRVSNLVYRLFLNFQTSTEAEIVTALLAVKEGKMESMVRYDK